MKQEEERTGGRKEHLEKKQKRTQGLINSKRRDNREEREIDRRKQEEKDEVDFIQSKAIYKQHSLLREDKKWDHEQIRQRTDKIDS